MHNSEPRHLQVVQLPELLSVSGALEGLKLLPRGDQFRLLLWDAFRVYVLTVADVRDLSSCVPSVVDFAEMINCCENSASEVILLNRKGSLCLWTEVIKLFSNFYRFFLFLLKKHSKLTSIRTRSAKKTINFYL